ncbi:hypothetical protein RsTz2092_13660 [Deferribacterales bacterium RsTz2092]|nr:hypothetical protein AGMMS49941_12890 [Deferribacterales bacterium]
MFKILNIIFLVFLYLLANGIVHAEECRFPRDYYDPFNRNKQCNRHWNLSLDIEHMDGVALNGTDLDDRFFLGIKYQKYIDHRLGVGFNVRNSKYSGINPHQIDVNEVSISAMFLGRDSLGIILGLFFETPSFLETYAGVGMNITLLSVDTDFDTSTIYVLSPATEFGIRFYYKHLTACLLVRYTDTHINIKAGFDGEEFNVGGLSLGANIGMAF